MSKKNVPTTATQRLKQDFLRISRDPVPYVTAAPLPSNILEWHYVVRGPEGTPYTGGLYHGKLVFPAEYPFKPPTIYMITPNGRFKCHTRLCLSITDFHPESWNPAWSVSTILTGLLSFMCEENHRTLGSIESSDFEKRQLASKSGEFNLRDKTFCELFPNIVQEVKEELERRQLEEEQRLQNTDPTITSPNALDNGLLGSTLANIAVLVGFAAFAYTVKYVLRSLGQ